MTRNCFHAFLLLNLRFCAQMENARQCASCTEFASILRMLSEPPRSAAVPLLSVAVRAAIALRYRESGGERYGISAEYFEQIVTGVVVRYAAGAAEAEQLELLAGLRVEELALARACS